MINFLKKLFTHLRENLTAKCEKLHESRPSEKWSDIEIYPFPIIPSSKLQLYAIFPLPFQWEMTSTTDEHKNLQLKEPPKARTLEKKRPQEKRCLCFLSFSWSNIDIKEREIRKETENVKGKERRENQSPPRLDDALTSLGRFQPAKRWWPIGFPSLP